MKKHFITLMSFAVTLFTAISLTSCGEEVDIQGGKSLVTTTFSAENGELSGTRTSMDADRWFYWTIGDKIWVDNGTSYIMSIASDITGNKQPRAKFKLDGDYTGAQYNVLYTGYTGTVGKDTTNTSSTTVTISTQQTQSEWNNADHLAVSGDCGRARAYKQNNGSYHFSLEHQAAYLVFYPFLNSSLSANNYTLQRIEIYSDAGGSNIAGTYPFTFANGLADTPNAGTAGQAVTLTCGDNFNLRMDIPDLTSPTAYNHCFAVIAPGTHQLTINYVVKNAANDTFTFVQDVDVTQYSPNTVYPFTFELSNGNLEFMLAEEFNEVNSHYRWGWTYESYSTARSDYDLSTSEATEGFWSDIPTEVEMNYYRYAGVYYDNSVKWKYNRRNGNQTIERSGWWVKKMAHIPSSVIASATYAPRNTIIGRPDEAVRSQYFFLPAFNGINEKVSFWTRTPTATSPGVTTTQIAKAADFTANSVYEAVYMKHNGFSAGTRPDGSKLWQ